MSVVIENPSLDGARAVVPDESLSTYELRGWVAVGYTTDPAREPVLTDTEFVAAQREAADRIAALRAESPLVVDEPEPIEPDAASETTEE